MTDRFEPYRRYNASAHTGGLSVFMPCVHGMRSFGVAGSLRLGGHRLTMNGPTSTAFIQGETIIPPNVARGSWGENVHSYEGDEIYRNPPDVMIVGREDSEATTYELWRELSRRKPIVLCALSGVFQSRFTWEIYRGNICSDLPSRMISRYYDIPAIRYRELFVPDRFPYVPFVDQGVFPLRSYINGLESRFPKSYAIQQDCAAALSARFGTRVDFQNLDGKTSNEVREAMIMSAMMLHVKDEDGFGWAPLESLSTGRPLIAQSGLARNMAFNDWVEPGVTGFLFRDADELVRLIETFVDDPAKLEKAQRLSAQIVRERFDGIDTGHDLNAFLEDLVRLERARWFPGRPISGEQRAVKAYEPSTDPETKQDFELIWEDALSSATHNLPVKSLSDLQE